MIKNKILLIFVFVLFFVSFRVSFASLVINEVQILPTGERFVELYNSSANEIDLTGFYIQRKTETGSSFSSLVSSTNFQNKKIGAKSYFLISRSNLSGSDIVLDLTLTDSNTIQIKNSEGLVMDMICWGNTNCEGLKISENPSEGKSIQRSNNSLFVSSPTPKKENIFSENQNNSITENNTSNTTSSETSVASNNTAIDSNIKKDFSLKVNAPALGFVDMPIKFYAEVLDPYNQKVVYGKYFWNFGDGNSKEIRGGLGENFNYTYFYPGEYNVSVFYYKNEYIEEPSIVKNFVVKVIPVSLVISRVGDEKDFFVEIENKSDSSVSLYGFSLRSVNSNFTFPKFSTIEKGKKIILSPKTTGFNFEDKKYLKLLDDNQKIIFDYGATISSEMVEVKSASSNPLRKINQNTTITSLTTNQESFIFENPDSENYDLSSVNLEANASSSFEGGNNNFYFVLLLIFVFFGAFGIYFIRRNKKEFVAGDDFEILEE